ncbi:DUF6907 domain-containing protein [Streptomyces europaeiscabiei]|uniref:DUF6907 domain-containing protein n=1 Tax=Streptomyces europaeiscabiei TaxID=146819 RepID=UPI0029AC41DE|nr:hypothetical protein [Streptomyces europaeiscabiei]MDX3582982.1 hypothetical protein [Streptomyces europaeiscabiei]
MSSLPTYGPTELQNANDDTGPAVAVVRVDFQMSREELATAFAYGYAETNQDRPVEDMSVEDVRADVEGYLAATGYLQFSQNVADMRAGTPVSPAVQAAFAAALDRAYPLQPVPAAVQAPRYGNGTVTLQTLDRGEVVVDEPAWCVGHDGEPVGHRADVTHNGVWTAGELEVDGDTVEFLRVRISHAPLTELQPEPRPVADVDGFPALDAEQLRDLAAKVGAHAGRLYSKANELDRLRRAES